VNLHQKQPAAFTLSAWSRAEGVDGSQDDNYCLRYVTCHVTNYTVQTQHTLQLAPGTHDWQQVSGGSGSGTGTGPAVCRFVGHQAVKPFPLTRAR